MKKNLLLFHFRVPSSLPAVFFHQTVHVGEFVLSAQMPDQADSEGAAFFHVLQLISWTLTRPPSLKVKRAPSHQPLPADE